MDDTANLRRMADARDGRDPLAALALSGAADEIERLRSAIETMHPGFCVEEAIAMFGTQRKEP